MPCSLYRRACLIKAEVMETLLYGCVTWTLGQEHFAELRTAHHNLLLRIIGFQRRQRTIMGAVQRTTNERLTHRVMFGTVGWWGEPGTRPTRKKLGPMTSRHQGIPNDRGVH